MKITTKQLRLLVQEAAQHRSLSVDVVDATRKCIDAAPEELRQQLFTVIESFAGSPPDRRRKLCSTLAIFMVQVRNEDYYEDHCR